MSENPQSEPRLLRTAEVAEILRLTPGQVRKKANAGVIPARRLGGRGSSLRFDEAELRAWLDAPEPPAPGGAA
jgi:excisionase family DNA binding protein